MIETLTQLLSKAQKASTKTLAIAAAEDKYVLNAIAKAKHNNLIIPIYVGNKELIKSLAKDLGLKIEDHEIIHEENNDLACMHAVKLVSSGKADLLMKGLVSTGILLKHVVNKEYGLLSGSLLSHLAIFESPKYHKLIGVTDAAMNIAPNIDEKTAIMMNAVHVFHALGYNKPKVALLTAVEKVNPKIKATLDAEQIKLNASKEITDLCFIDGPLALDNAISKEAAEHKNIGGPVAGDADILLAPDLNSGNILYKSLSFLGEAKCAAIITGSIAPIILTSRADTEETKFLSIALGVLSTKK